MKKPPKDLKQECNNLEVFYRSLPPGLEWGVWRRNSGEAREGEARGRGGRLLSGSEMAWLRQRRPPSVSFGEPCVCLDGVFSGLCDVGCEGPSAAAGPLAEAAASGLPC